MEIKQISESTFTITANGFADGPAQALRDYLLKKNAKKVITILHPLVPEGGSKHIITTYEAENTSSRVVSAPLHPPFTYPLDLFIPLRVEPSTAWFGFNNLGCLRGLLRRKVGRTEKVYYWAVDFSPERFGKGLATKVYDYIDRYVCRVADGRVELTEPARIKRPKYLGLKKKELAPSLVIPMGAWLERTPKITKSAWKNKKIVYLGHLVERQGVETLVKAVSILVRRGYDVKAEIIGRGPVEDDLKSLAKSLGVSSALTFHGFVEDHREVENILASGSIAVAPYRNDPTNFTQFSDPGKLKAYLGAGLPFVLTDVPPNASDLEKAGVAIVSKDTPDAFADSIELFLKDEKKWQDARKAAENLAKEFDWDRILKNKLRKLGFE